MQITITAPGQPQKIDDLISRLALFNFEFSHKDKVVTVEFNTARELENLKDEIIKANIPF